MSARDTGPKYYADQPIQPWDVIDADAPPEERVGYYRWTAVTYLMRMGNKEGNPRSQEVKKAKHYLEKLLEVLEGLELAPDQHVDPSDWMEQMYGKPFHDWASADAKKRWEERNKKQS